MRTSGRNVGSRLGLALVFVVALAGVAAAEVATVAAPEGEAFLVTATLVPSGSGADLYGEKGQGHVDFRIRFGSDRRLYVNGCDAGEYDPAATYHITVIWQKVGSDWFATTDITNQSTGAPVFHQCSYATVAVPDEFRAVAEEVAELTAQ